jgi:DNA-binding response OmpR family regulator
MRNVKGNPAKIMIIDDDPTVLKLVEKTFNDRGYNVISAFDTVNGVESVARELPDLLLLDVVLPNQDGFDFLKQLKAGSATARIPVIMLTVRRLDNDVQKGIDLGAEDYISKPIHAGLLIKRAENVLKKILED